MTTAIHGCHFGQPSRPRSGQVAGILCVFHAARSISEVYPTPCCWAGERSTARFQATPIILTSFVSRPAQGLHGERARANNTAHTRRSLSRYLLRGKSKYSGAYRRGRGTRQLHVVLAVCLERTPSTHPVVFSFARIQRPPACRWPMSLSLSVRSCRF